MAKECKMKINVDKEKTEAMAISTKHREQKKTVNLKIELKA